MPDEKPFWQHDCKECIYLGTIDGDEGVLDLYLALHSVLTPFIVRYGDDAHEYMIMPKGVVEATPVRFQTPALLEALRRAKERKLL